MEPWRQVLVSAWEDSRLTLDELADRSGLNRGTIHRILDDVTNDPGFNTIAKLAAAFGDEVSRRVAGTLMHDSRPGEESGRETLGAGPGGGARLADLLEGHLAALDGEAPAEDSWRGDVLKAIAALTRALRRPNDSPSLAEPSQKARR